jgi:Flp pilus assembly protein TadG
MTDDPTPMRRANSTSSRGGALGRLTRDRRGVAAIMFATLLVPMFWVIGAAVDYARLEQFKSQLQATVDSAALSGAAAYVTASDSSTAQTIATNYVTSNVNELPPHVGTITPSVSATQLTTGANQGYTVSVSVTSKIGTTFLRIFSSTLSASASALAVNPKVTITVSLNGFKSDAGDANTLYYWQVQASSPTTVPSTSTFSSSNELASNKNSSNPNVNINNMSATQNLGIAMQNVTGGNSGYYGCTQYQTASGESTKSQCYLQTQWFFSNIEPPSDNSNNVSGYQKESENCSIITALTTSAPTSLTPPSSGKCFTSAASHSYFSCSQLNGEYLTFYWNDMGGTTDDKDYNDAEISINCSGVTGTGNSATNVYLAS